MFGSSSPRRSQELPPEPPRRRRRPREPSTPWGTKLANILASPFHSLRSGLGATSPDTVHETRSKTGGKDKSNRASVRSSHTRARPRSTTPTSNPTLSVRPPARPREQRPRAKTLPPAPPRPQPFAHRPRSRTVTLPPRPQPLVRPRPPTPPPKRPPTQLPMQLFVERVVTPKPEGPLSESGPPGQLHRRASNPKRYSLSGSIRRRLAFGPATSPGEADGEIQPSLTRPSAPEPAKSRTSAQSFAAHSASTPSLVPTKRRGALPNWAIKSLDHISSFSSSSSHLARPPSCGPVEDERRRAIIGLAAPKPPNGSESNIERWPDDCSSESGHTMTLGESVGHSGEEPNPKPTIHSVSPTPAQEQDDWSSIASQGYFSAIISGSSEQVPPSAWPPESNAGQLGPSNVGGASPNPIITSMLSSSEIITLLEERGCKNMSSRLNLEACSQYPVYNGGLGDVYSGKLSNGAKVAIKAIRPYAHEGLHAGKYQKRSAKELYTWSKCNHPNVARLLGLAEFHDRLAMISEWAEHGSLPTYINDHPSVDRCSLSISICEGLVYLHENNIVHGDLKGANVLVSSDGTPMLTDFGNANLGTATISFTETAATPGYSLRWTAPEIIKYSSPPSRPGDVYALGMTILETLTGQVPFSNLKDLSITRIVVDKKSNPKRPEQIPTRSICGNILWGVLLSCWAYEPRLRPSVMQVRDHVKHFTPETLEYIEPEPDSEGDSDNSDQ